MSQFGFGQQIGQQRDALGGSSRSNYASEEADLTDGLIKQVETIDIPNTNQFYENIKFVEKVKEQGNLINTMKQIAGTFEAGARFKTAFDAMKAKNDSIDRLRPGLESIDTENIANIAKQNQEIYNKEDAEEAQTANNLELEKQGSTQQHQESIVDLQYDMFHSPEKLNFRQTGNEIDGAIQVTHGNLSTQTGLDRITTTGEAREFVGVNGTSGKILEGIFYEYAERGFDITNKRVQNRILARHAETILKAEQAAFNTWSTNHRQKVQLAQQETLKTDIYAAVSKGDANSLFGDNGLVQQTNAIIYGGASQATSSLWVSEQIKKGIEANVIVGTEGLTISDNMIDDIFEKQPVTINGKQYDSYSDIPDNIISANVKNQTKVIVTDAMRKRRTEQANNIEEDRTNFNNNFVRTNVTQFVQNLKTTEQRKLFYSSENGVNIALRYMNEISKPENKHLAQYGSNGELIIPNEISSIFAKSDTGVSDTAVSTKEDKASTFNDIEEKLITSSVKEYKYGKALEKELVGDDFITVERARDALYTEYLANKDELDTLIANRPSNKSAKSVELDYIRKIFKDTILPNIQKGVYDKAGTAGVTLDLIFNKGIMIEQFENNGDLQNSVVPVGLAEKNNFERSKSWLNSGRTINKDVLSFYEDVPMFKVLSDGTKVPMTNLEKWTHRAKAIGALSDEDGDGILEYDDTRKYFTMKDLAKLRKQPTDGKYLQITAEVLPNFKEALLAMKPSASSDFNTYEANFPTTGRSVPRKNNLQNLSLEEIQALVLTHDMNKIGYFELDGERLYNTINELTSKGMIKKNQKFDQNAQFYVRMYMLQKNINQRRRSLSGLTVIPFAKGQQPVTMGIGGKGTDGGTTTLGNTQDDSDWLGIPNFSLNDLEIMRRVFPLIEAHPMSDFATMTKDVSKIFLDELAKDGGKKFFEKDRYLQHEISRKAILDALTPKPVDTTKRKRN